MQANSRHVGLCSCVAPWCALATSCPSRIHLPRWVTHARGSHMHVHTTPGLQSSPIQTWPLLPCHRQSRRTEGRQMVQNCATWTVCYASTTTNFLAARYNMWRCINHCHGIHVSITVSFFLSWEGLAKPYRHKCKLCDGKFLQSKLFHNNIILRLII